MSRANIRNWFVLIRVTKTKYGTEEAVFASARASPDAGESISIKWVVLNRRRSRLLRYSHSIPVLVRGEKTSWPLLIGRF